MNTQKENTNVQQPVPLKEQPVVQKLIQIILSKKLRAAISYIIPTILFLAASAISVYYIFWASQGEFHADCTDTIMWAFASNESGSVFNTDFNYACFLPFGINLIMQPLISIFGLSLTAHHFGMLAFFILLTVFFVLMLREMHVDIRYNLLAATAFIALTFSSEKSREIFWGHTIYYSLGLLFIVIGLFLYFKLLNIIDRRTAVKDDAKAKRKLSIQYIITLVILCAFIALTATDGISALSIFALPLAAGVFAQQVLDSKSKLISRKSMFTFGHVVLFFLMILLGSKLLAYWQGDMVAGYQDAYSMFSATDKWMENALTIPVSWLRLFGVQDLTGIKLSDKEGIVNLIYIFTAIVIAVLPVVATCFYPKYKNDTKGKMLRIFIWIHWAVTAIILVGFICGLLSAANWRLIPLVGTSIMTGLMFIIWAITSKASASRISVIFAIPIIVVSFLNFKTVVKMPADNYKENVLFAIADVLEDQELTYGYATFWNANSITLITENEVKVRDVDVNDNGVSKRLYQSAESWYGPQEGQENYFLLVSAYEYSIVETSAPHLINECYKKITMSYAGQDFTIMVFDHNIV